MASQNQSAHSRAAQVVVKLDPADGRVRLEVGELVSEQDSRHGRVFCSRSRTGPRTLTIGLKRAGPCEGTRKSAVIGCSDSRQPRPSQAARRAKQTWRVMVHNSLFSVCISLLKNIQSIKNGKISKITVKILLMYLKILFL